MTKLTHPPANGAVRILRKVYKPLGFSKGYNFTLFFIFAGALFGFSLSRLPYLDVYGVFCSQGGHGGNHAAPGECWYYLRGNYLTVGIFLHLIGILIGAILACFQFVPVIRHKLLIAHRINGYIVLLLSFIGTAGAYMIMGHAFGGSLDIQMVMGLVGILFIGSLTMSYINIKRLQIEEHRAWMLRAWFYASSIVTLRLIMSISALVISSLGDYYAVRPCGQINDALVGNRTAVLSTYPDCAMYYSGAVANQRAIVQANMSGNPVEISVALGLNFGAAGWLALALHAIGIEIYLSLTPAEHDRLRNVSYQRQTDARMKNPGKAGFTVDRFGDSKAWVPEEG